MPSRPIDPDCIPTSECTSLGGVRTLERSDPRGVEGARSSPKGCTQDDRACRAVDQNVLARGGRIRIERLLRQEAVAVLEVSARTSFVDHHRFTKVFRRLTGFTTTAYRAAV